MTDHSERACTCAARWVDDMLRAAYPQTAGVTRAALEALAGRDSYTAAQVAYLMSVMFDVGAMARAAGDRAEVRASCAAAFEPEPTRQARIAIRTGQMAEEHEIAWLRRTGDAPPAPWPGGTPEEAMERFMWDDEGAR